MSFLKVHALLGVSQHLQNSENNRASLPAVNEVRGSSFYHFATSNSQVDLKIHVPLTPDKFHGIVVESHKQYSYPSHHDRDC